MIEKPDLKEFHLQIKCHEMVPSNTISFFKKKLFYHYGYRKQLIMFEIKNQLKSYFFT